MRGISWLGEDRLASQEGLCSMELVSSLVITKVAGIPVTLLDLYFGDVYFEPRSVPVIGYLTQEFTDPGLPVTLATVFCTVAIPLQILSHSFITFPLPPSFLILHLSSLPPTSKFNFCMSLNKFLHVPEQNFCMSLNNFLHVPEQLSHHIWQFSPCTSSSCPDDTATFMPCPLSYCWAYQATACWTLKSNRGKR